MLRVVRSRDDAAAAGDLAAQVVLGGMHYEGRGGAARDHAAALAWARRGAAGHMIDGNFMVATMNELGEGGLAAGGADGPRLYRIAAEAGHPVARYRLGVCYSKARGVQQDRAEAARHWRIAAELGWPPAQADMANSLIHGIGVEQNFAEALRFAKMADASGHPHGALHIGIMHHNGWGRAADHTAGVKWLSKAARMGDEPSRQLLMGWAVGGDSESQAALARL